MIFFKFSNFKILPYRRISTVKTVETKFIKKSVFISQSNDIFSNLALEDWLYRNYNFTNHHILMMWRNNPCITIGTHQNPWLEANISELNNITENGVQLARRSSGGGTVYHDQGNINLTFFSAKNEYNRKHNLELIVRALFRQFGVKIDISPKEDLMIRNLKISDSAAKFGRSNAYHHCTLLVKVDKSNLSQALKKQKININTNATKSVTSKIHNLNDENPQIDANSILSAIGWEYMRTLGNSFKDGGKSWANLQNGFQFVNPTEQWFHGISKLRDDLMDWEWCYGKTPKFSVTKSFPVPIQFLNNYNNANVNLRITMTVEQGRVKDVLLYIPPGLSSTGFSGEAKVITNFKGRKFTEDAINSFKWSLSGSEYGLINDKDKFVTECVRQVMTSI